MILAEYLNKHRISLKEFSEKIGYDAKHLSHLTHGTQRVSIKLARAVFEETNGKVVMPIVKKEIEMTTDKFLGNKDEGE